MTIDSPELPQTGDVPTDGPIATNWAHWRDVALAVLAWVVLAYVILQLAGYVMSTLLVAAVAALLAYALAPAIAGLSRWMPRMLAIFIVYVLFFSVLAGLVYLVVTTAVGEVVPLAKYIQQQITSGAWNQSLTQLIGTVGITQSQLDSFGQQLLGQAQGVALTLGSVLGDVAGALVDLVVIIVLSVYFVSSGPRLRAWLHRGAPLSQRGFADLIVDTLNRVVGGYIRGQTLLSALIGVLVGVGMQYLFHLPYAALLGLLAFVLEFIPFLGVLISGAMCGLVGLTIGPVTALLVLAYFIVVHVIEGDVIGPRIVGSAVGVHPALTLIALITGADLFGIWGALFATPVAGVIQSLILAFFAHYRAQHPEEYPHQKPVADPVAVPQGERAVGD